MLNTFLLGVDNAISTEEAEEKINLGNNENSYKNLCSKGIVLDRRCPRAVNFIRLIFQYPGQPLVALTVVLALFATVLVAKVIGGMLPIIAKRLKLDPAIMAAPLITTIVDAVSLVIYFQIAVELLHIK